MNFCKCRVCLKLNPLPELKSLCLNLSVNDHGISTVYDMLLFCIPHLFHSLQKSDFICIECLDNLIECVRFIKLCIQSDDRIKQELVENSNSETFEEDNKAFVFLSCENNDSYDDLNTEKKYNFAVEETLDIKPEIQEITPNQENDEINNTTLIDTSAIEEEDLQYNKSQLKLLLEGKHPSNKSIPRRKNRLKNFSKTTLTKNQRVVNPDAKSYRCRVCGIKIKKAQKSQHVCRFTCTKCKTKFDSKSELEIHVTENTHLNDCESLCPHCSISILSKDFQEHLKTHATIMCELCSKCFTSVTALKKHGIVHSEKTEKCPECELSFKCKGALQAHLNQVHKRREKEVLCDLCPKKYYNYSNLMAHKRRHHLQIRNATCPKCGKMFNDQKAVESHDSLVHLKLKPFSCEHCDKPFGRKDYMLNHAKNCLQLQESRRNTPYKHIKSNEPVECAYCHKVLKNIGNLRLHIRSIHTKAPRNYKCDECGLQFAAKTSLVKHKLIHSDPASKYRCDVCFKKYKSSDELQDHVAEKHKNKPYDCDVCGEKFCRKFLMENHRYAVHPNAPNSVTGEEKAKEILEEALRRLGSSDSM